jgi:hypothetical protein
MPSLLSLPSEIVCELIKDLPIEDALNLLKSCRKNYHDGKYAFDKRCFRTLSLSLEPASLAKARRFVEKEQCRFLQEIFIRLDNSNYSLWPDALQRRARRNLNRILRKGFEVSTKCETIIIKYGSTHQDYRDETRAVAMAIKAVSSIQGVNHFTVQIQQMATYTSGDLLEFGKEFLHRVHSLEVIIDESDWDFDPLNEALTFMTNLKKLSLSADNEYDFLESDIISETMTKVNCESLESLTLKSFRTSEDELQEILHPFKASIKELNLQKIAFYEESFTSFIKYISDNLSLDHVSLEEIWEDSGDGEYEIVTGT